MDIGILLWNTCNARCAHCAVSSGPKESRNLSQDQIKSIIDATFYDCASPSIGLSGGEAFFYFDDLLDIISYATAKGARVAVNTNCFWATDIDAAREIVRKVKAAGLSKIVASTDDFHEKYIDQDCVMQAIEACLQLHLEIEIQFVANKKTSRLHDFLRKYEDKLINISCREIPCHPVGRACGMSQNVLITRPDIPTGKCPNAVLSVSADGAIIPCCNTAGHLPALQLGRVDDDLPKLHNTFLNSPLMAVLWAQGPIGFLPVAEDLGYAHPSTGYVDQCHLCYELFKDRKRAEAIKTYARDAAFSILYAKYRANIGSDPVTALEA